MYSEDLLVIKAPILFLDRPVIPVEINSQNG